jgi:hypothetical protein
LFVSWHIARNMWIDGSAANRRGLRSLSACSIKGPVSVATGPSPIYAMRDQ